MGCKGSMQGREGGWPRRVGRAHGWRLRVARRARVVCAYAGDLNLGEVVDEGEPRARRTKDDHRRKPEIKRDHRLAGVGVTVRGGCNGQGWV